MNPMRGEIWIVDFEPQEGAEITKQRPAVVVNLPVEQILPVRLVVPFTSWQASFAGRITKVQVQPSRRNGLSKVSAADIFQTRTASITRFRQKVGDLEASVLSNVADCLAVLIDAK